jgi:predicted anti-sigma-YlaC factor YlaD
MTLASRSAAQPKKKPSKVSIEIHSARTLSGARRRWRNAHTIHGSQWIAAP